jgi:hypothetical protein
MPKLLHKGDISLRVRPVALQSEQAFLDLSLSPLLTPLSRPGGQASMRGGASFLRIMAADFSGV